MNNIPSQHATLLSMQLQAVRIYFRKYRVRTFLTADNIKLTVIQGTVPKYVENILKRKNKRHHCVIVGGKQGSGGQSLHLMLSSNKKVTLGPATNLVLNNCTHRMQLFSCYQIVSNGYLIIYCLSDSPERYIQ